MLQQINIELEKWMNGSSQPFHPAGSKFQYRKAQDLTDAPARLTPRQAVFYRDLIRIAEELQSSRIPIDFLDAYGAHQTMDLGCVKIAEHAGFILPLYNDPDGFMRTIQLSWSVTVVK